jgi:hypothetical protein
MATIDSTGIGENLMSEILNLGLVPILICSVLILAGMAIERWLTTNGFVRDKTASVIVVVICSVIIKQIWFDTISWLYFVPLIFLAMIFSVNRGDLWTTMNKGRWWWKSENENKN